MTARVQHRRFLTAGAALPPMVPGLLWVNHPDRRIGYADQAGAGQDLVGTRPYATTASYLTNDLAARGGNVLRARAAVSPGAFNPAQWSQTQDKLGLGTTAHPTDLSDGSLYAGSANAVAGVGLSGAFALNAYKTPAGAWKARETGASAYWTIAGGAPTFWAAPSVAAGAAPSGVAFASMDPSSGLLTLPTGKVLISGPSFPFLNIRDTASALGVGLAMNGPQSTLMVQQLDAAGASVGAPISQFRTTDRAFIHSGDIYMAGAGKALFIDPANTYEWRMFRDAGTGDHINQHRNQWLDRWVSASGTRQWNSPAGTLMSLDGSGNLAILGSFNPGSLAVAGNATVGGFLNVTSNIATNGNVYFSNLVSPGQFYLSATGGNAWLNLETWQLKYRRDNSTLSYTRSSDNFNAMVLDAAGNMAIPGTFTAGVVSTPNAQFGTMQTLNAFINAALVVNGSFNAISGHFADTLAVANTLNASNALINSLSVAIEAYKPGGGPFAAISDVRSKDLLWPFHRGLSDLKKLIPWFYRYKGDKTQKVHVGLIAQQVEEFWPEMVSQHGGVINGEPTEDMRVMHLNEMQFAVLNALRQLDHRLMAVEELGHGNTA